MGVRVVGEGEGRVEMGDLKVPSRINQAQAGPRQDFWYG